MREAFRSKDLFTRLHAGEKIKCNVCKKGIIKPMGDGPIERESSFECDNCKAHYRYDSVNVIVE